MSYPGGKAGSGVYQTIINQMPPHDVYIEPFLGGGAIMRAKRPAVLSIGIDLSAEACRRASSWATGAGTRIVNGDGIAWLQRRRNWSGRELVYCDPPYVRSARRSARPIYQHEMTDADHRRLLTVLRALPCMVMISGYPSPLYSAMLQGWRVVTFRAQTRSGRPAIEHLWCNFGAPAALHDYRYLGADYRDRERIKRKVGRWRAKLATLPTVEQQAILSALVELASPTASVRDLLVESGGTGLRDPLAENDGADVGTGDNGDGAPPPLLAWLDSPSSQMAGARS